jgi:BolA family transcriptional regulator, general stress-responsive regulator
MHSETAALIKSKLIEALTPDSIEVIDDSHKHIGHAGNTRQAGHFTLHIQAPALNELNKVKAHQKIYAILDSLFPEKIHALSIQIKK